MKRLSGSDSNTSPSLGNRRIVSWWYEAARDMGGGSEAPGGRDQQRDAARFHTARYTKVIDPR